MSTHEARSHYGSKLVVYQCPDCSGFWVDGNVVGSMGYDSALEIEDVVDFSEISSEPNQIAAFCPRCETYLVEQIGGGMPKGLRIDFCKVCCGYWFDKGELMIYKSYIEKRRQKYHEHEEKQRLKKQDTQLRRTTDISVETGAGRALNIVWKLMG